MLTALAALFLAAPPSSFELKDGDRVVWIGNACVEREQRYGYWESALLAHFADKNITFRNLGWSGDNVFGEARAAFDPVAKGYERLVSLTLELKPTVIFVSYGTNESFEGEAGLEKFEKGLTKLLDDLKPSKARVVLFTPLPFEPSNPELVARNKTLSLYRDRIRSIAASRGDTLADLFGEPFSLGLTNNGMHLSRDGYEHTAVSFLSSLGISHAPSSVEAEKLEAVRRAVIAKNQLFFYKWRPENQTYLTGFRKHEQGKNAKELVEFDPFIDASEKGIRAALAR